MGAAEWARCSGFQWDEGNLDKSWSRHRVSPFECEQIFFNRPLIVAPDEKHSQKEERSYASGQTDSGRLLFVVFTTRKRLIRIVSARDMTKREIEEYSLHEE